jgi:4-amino-4-deoxy-L-arabinose transferase-like glycosyltransferase
MRKRVFIRIMIVIALVLCTLFLMYILSFSDYNVRYIQMIMQAAILTAIALYVFLIKSKSSAFNTAILLLLFIGFVMRIGYAVYTPIDVRAHDLGAININSNGNAAYILCLYINHSLPTSNIYQFMQPPLFHVLAALIMSLSRIITGIQDPVLLLESARLVSCLASCATLVVAYKIAKSLQLNECSLLLFISITAFLPNHYLLAGRINNDALSVFWMYCIILFTIRWYHKQNILNIVMLALMFGFGLMTKFSVAMLSIPVGVLMIYVLYQASKKHEFWRLLMKMTLFLLIASSLGLWFYIRNWILFKQPIGAVYVFKSEIYDWLYIGDQSFWTRFGVPSIREFFQGYGLAETSTSNVWTYLAKCPIFGEFGYEISRVFKFPLQASHTMIILLSLIGTAYTIRNSIHKKHVLWLFVSTTWLSITVSYFVFIIQYPFFCSLDFRYMVPVSLCGALFIGNYYDKSDRTKKVPMLFRMAVNISTILFSVTSIVMYTNLIL